GKHAEAQKAPHPIEEEKAKIDKSKRTVSSFAPSRGALYSLGSGVLLVALLMLGLWVLQVRQHHAVEELLMKQDKAHIREVRQLNQRLEEMSDQKTVLLWLMASHGWGLWTFGSEGLHGRRFQRRARDLQARAVESETLAAKLQMRTEELETQSQQQAVDSSTREKALRDLRGELKSAREEENATVAHFVEQLSRDTGTLAEAVEQDRENLEKSKAVLTLQARALTSCSLSPAFSFL
ncbi:PPC16, partial [Symbiodinium necroappetens]